MFEQLLNPIFEGGGRRGATCARPLHFQIDPPFFKAAIDNVSAIIGNGRADARFDQVLDLFDHVGIVDAHHADLAIDREAAAIEAGANDFEPLTHTQNDDMPEGRAGARFITERAAVHEVSAWLKKNGWTIITAEIGHLAKSYPELSVPNP